MRSIKPLALILSVLPVCIAAQESPFHGGQWAMQFGGNANFFSLGVLRFTSARAAWLLDLSTSTTVLDATSTDNVGTTTSADEQFISLDARLGRRFYQPRQSKVVSFQSLGLEFGWSDQMVDAPTGNFRQTSWSTGPNFELGAAYMLNSGVSVGGTAALAAGYFSMKGKSTFDHTTGHGYYANIRVLLALGIYF